MTIRPQVSMAILYANLSISCYYQFQGQQLKKKILNYCKIICHFVFSPKSLKKCLQ